jgi:sporulation protein YlmC with PRC-barrel domain
MSDSSLTVAHPDEDVRGRKVVDRNGDEIGDVDDLMIDDREQRVRFMRVGAGGFLGIGETKLMIPIDAIIRITDDAVQVNQTRDYAANSPPYDPALADDVRDDYWGSAYGYWGYGPYWAPGYIYPPYPRYPY